MKMDEDFTNWDMKTKLKFIRLYRKCHSRKSAILMWDHLGLPAIKVDKDDEGETIYTWIGKDDDDIKN